jgi:hypothetical protein
MTSQHRRVGFARRAWRRRLGAGLLVLAMTSCAGASEDPGVTPALLAKARARGAVVVIVTLRVPEGASPVSIAAVKESLLAEISAAPHRVVRELAGLPQIALEVSEDALRLLGASPSVLRIAESIPQPPAR